MAVSRQYQESKIPYFWKTKVHAENWTMLTHKEIYGMVKKPTVTAAIRLKRLCWFGHVQRMEDNRIAKKVLYMNLEATRLRGRPRNRWQDEVRDDGTLVGGKGWKERVYNREEWKKLLRMARNRHILHMPMEWLNESMSAQSPEDPQPNWQLSRLYYNII
jgi:hypothetical protein